MMRMEKLKCEICGGKLSMHADGKTATCENCGMSYGTDWLKEKVQEIRGIVAVEGTVQTQQADFEIRAGELIAYHGRATDVVIPPGVRSIGEKSFANMAYITSVMIPDGVLSIGRSAFQYCVSLHQISFPSSLKSIGGWAFDCTALETATLPNGLNSIGDHAFFRCTSLKDAVIPDSITNMGTECFATCPSLEDVQILPQTVDRLYPTQPPDQCWQDRGHWAAFLDAPSHRFEDQTTEEYEASLAYCLDSGSPWYKRLYLQRWSVLKATKEKEDVLKQAEYAQRWRAQNRCQHCGGIFSFNPLKMGRYCSRCRRAKDYH